MGNFRLILVQPWFTAPGHPAQSTLNFVRVIPAESITAVIFPRTDAGTAFDEIAQNIASIVTTTRFQSFGSHLRINTALAALAASKFRRDFRIHDSRPLFIDADLFTLCLLYRLGLFGSSRVYVVQLAGPESSVAHPVKRAVTIAALRFGRLRILLRTPELVTAWRHTFPAFQECFQLLPAIESVLSPLPEAETPSGSAVHIGVIGQIRVGKAIPTLLAVAHSMPDKMVISVHGPLYPRQSESFIELMRRSQNVHVGFLSERDMLRVALQNDYISCLAEQDLWDTRMESASFWLAIKVGKPVLSFDEGWIGEMVRTTGCGVTVHRDRLQQDLCEIPGRASENYKKLRSNVRSLQKTRIPEALWRQLDAALNA